MNRRMSRKIAMVLILVFQIIFVVIFALFVEYDEHAKPRKPVVPVNGTEPPAQLSTPEYPMFQDIHVMVFIGFGFLMTFLKKYALSALGFTFLVSSLVIQWAILCQGVLRFHSVDDRISLSMSNMMNADITAAVILISLGAVLGKISPLQLLIMAIIETLVFAGNEYLFVEVLKAVDAGGSVIVHAFGAYFGLAVSFVLFKASADEESTNGLESSSYQNDIGALIGTLFLWMFWPSFNAGQLSGDEKWRTVVNTYLALTASCLTTFAMSSILNKEKKFEIAHVQNATLAGGVGVGSSVNMLIQPYGALIIGAIAGVLSTISFRFVQGFLKRKLYVHDTCGVNNLHGLPGLLGGLLGAIVTAFASEDSYGASLYSVFPAMGGAHHRSPGLQVGYQFAAVTATVAIAIGTGLLTGLSIRNFAQVEKHYDDDLIWDLEKDPPPGRGLAAKQQ